MRILVLGGSVFVGRLMVEEALRRGHSVTLFNRGQHNPELFPEAEKLRGDRDSDLEALQDGQWDAVLDMCGYVPRIVRRSCELLKARAPHYTFISSISVYDAEGAETLNEESPVAILDDPTVEHIDGETYGGLKALCEDVVRDVYGNGALIIRPGLIVGPWDRTDRFTYWPVRMARGGDVLVPDRKEQPVQYIDGRDLASFTVSLIEQKANGTFNGTGPESPIRLQDFFEKISGEAGGKAGLIWVSPQVLEAHEIKPWSDLPLVLPYDGSGDAMSRADVSKSMAAGLQFRPLGETVRDTLEWYEQHHPDKKLKAGLDAEREAAALADVRTQAV